MKHLRSILLASALVLTGGLRAETPVAPTASEAFPVYSEANRISEPAKMPVALRGVFTRLGEADTAVIPFVENRRMGILKKPVELSGTMRYSRKAGLSIAWEQPKPRVLIIDDIGLIERQPDGHERRIAANDRPELAVLTDIYLNLLRGKPAGLFNVCEVYFMGNANAWQIGLIPKDESLRRHTGRVLIGGGGREIAQISNLLENGDRRTLRLSKTEIDAKFSSSVIQSFFRTNAPDKQ
jgi:Outer membrane lipoprotein carrier protein LolA-like